MKATEFATEAEKVRLDPSCWDNKKIGNPKTKVKGGVRVNNCVPAESVAEGLNDTIYPNAEVIKSKNGKPVGEIYQDGNSWGAFHYRADRGYDFIDSREEAIEALKDLHQETGRSRPNYTTKGVAEGVSDLGYEAQSLITKLRRDVEEKRLQPTRQAVLSAARELAGDMDFAPELLVRQVLGQGMAEGGTGSGRPDPLAWDTTSGKVGRVEKNATGIRHHADPSRYGGSEPEIDPDTKLDKNFINKFEKGLDVKWSREKKYQGNVAVDEDFNGEYDDEAGMADNNLETLKRAVEGIDDVISAGDNLPEWCQEKIAVAKSMLVSVWDYMQSEESTGSSDELSRVLELSGMNLTEELNADQQFDMIEEMVEELAEEHGVDAETIWEDFESVDDHELYETAAWRRSAGKSKKGGLNRKGVASYRRENPGSKLQMAVTTKPSKLKPGSKAAKRRKSFCARMGGVKGPMKKPNGKPTRKALALRKWNC